MATLMTAEMTQRRPTTVPGNVVVLSVLDTTEVVAVWLTDLSSLSMGLATRMGREGPRRRLLMLWKGVICEGRVPVGDWNKNTDGQEGNLGGDSYVHPPMDNPFLKHIP